MEPTSPSHFTLHYVGFYASRFVIFHSYQCIIHQNSFSKLFLWNILYDYLAIFSSLLVNYSADFHFIYSFIFLNFYLFFF